MVLIFSKLRHVWPQNQNMQEILGWNTKECSEVGKKCVFIPFPTKELYFTWRISFSEQNQHQFTCLPLSKKVLGSMLITPVLKPRNGSAVTAHPLVKWLNSLRSLLYNPFFCNFIVPWNDCLAPLQTIVDNFTMFHRFHSQAFSQEVSLSKSILTYLLLAEMITTSWSWRLWQYDCVVAPCMFQVGVPDWA